MEKRLVKAIESIEKSLSILAKDTKTNRKAKLEATEQLENLVTKIEESKDDPFGIKFTKEEENG